MTLLLKPNRHVYAHEQVREVVHQHRSALSLIFNTFSSVCEPDNKLRLSDFLRCAQVFVYNCMRGAMNFELENQLQFLLCTCDTVRDGGMQSSDTGRKREGKYLKQPQLTDSARTFACAQDYCRGNKPPLCFGSAVENNKA